MTIMHLMLLAQSETYSPGGAEVGVSILSLLIQLVFVAILLVAMWKIFVKAGKPGWAAIVPIYNGIVLLEIVGRPIWWIVLMLIPFVNIVIGIILAIDLAKSFGKSGGFAAGLILLSFIFYPILGFGSATYKGPSAATA